MVRKFIPTILIIATLSIVFLIYFLVTKYKTHKSTIVSPVITAVPINVAFFIESNNTINFIKSLYERNNAWKKFCEIPNIASINKQLVYIDSITQHDKTIRLLIEKNTLLISAHLIGKDRYEFLFLLGLPDESNYNTIYSFIKNCIKNDASIRERNYDNSKIYEVSFNNPNNSITEFSFSFKKGIFIASKSSILVEESIRQLYANTNLLTDNQFIKIARTTGKNVEANIYINYKKIPALASVFFDKRVEQAVQSFINFSNWSALDVTIKENSLFLNGFTYSAPTDISFTNIIINQPCQSINIPKILPANTSTFLLFGIDNYKTFNEEYSKYLQSIGKAQQYNNNLKQIENATGINLKKIFETIFNNEIAYVFTDINSLDIAKNTYIVLSVNSRSQAETELTTLLKSYAERNGKILSEYTDVFKVDNEITYPIYYSPFPEMLSCSFGNVFNESSANCFTFIDNYIVFGNNKSSLTSFIQANVLGKTLENDNNYKKFSENISNKSNILFYSNIAASPELYANYLKKNTASIIKDNISTFRKFQALAIQLSTEGEFIYNNIYMNYNPVYKEPPRTVWESRLEANTEMKPKIVINHNTNEKEIFIQDVNNKIYLINSAGRVLWSVPITEKIISDIYQIDIFKNKKLQYVFSSKNNIYILDRLGNFLKPYPLKLRSPATNGINVFDYENTRDYRLFIACEDRKIYCYSTDGAIIKGWEFDKTENIVTTPIQHCRVQDKDYIIFADKLKIYILDRRGTTRVGLTTYFTKSKNNLLCFENKTPRNEPRLVTTDTTGKIYFIYLNGKVQTTSINNYSSSHFFEFQDVNGDGYNDFIFADDDKLDVYEQNKKKLFSCKFDYPISFTPQMYIFPGNKRLIGVVCKTIGQLYLITVQGTLYEGFPLNGVTPFSIVNLNETDDKFNLFVGGDDNFLYNYEVN